MHFPKAPFLELTHLYDSRIDHTFAELCCQPQTQGQLLLPAVSLYLKEISMCHPSAEPLQTGGWTGLYWFTCHGHTLCSPHHTVIDGFTSGLG